MLYWFDFEVYRNYFLALFLGADSDVDVLASYIEADKRRDRVEKDRCLSLLNLKKFMVYKDTNNIQEFIKFVNNPHNTFVGFNNNYYDDVVMDYIVIRSRFYKTVSNNAINLDIKHISDMIIANGTGVRKIEPLFKGYKHQYESWDTLNGIFETVQRKPLKQFMINLKWHRIQDLPVAPDDLITDDMLYDLEDYCFNDVLGTKAIFDIKAEEYIMKDGLSTIYGLNLMNCNRSKIADKLLAKFYSEATGLHYYEFKDRRTFRKSIAFADIIHSNVHFQTPELQNFLMQLKRYVWSEGDKFKKEVYFRNNIYTFAKGGLHTKDKPGILLSNDKYMYTDCDAISYYPFSIINDKSCPAHLNQPTFTAIALSITTERAEAKKLGKSDKMMKHKAEGLKIVVNSGLFG